MMSEAAIQLEIRKTNQLLERTNQLLEHQCKQNAALYELLAARLPEPAVNGRPTPPWQQPAPTVNA